MSLTLLLRCADINQTRDFYESVLGFNVLATADTTITTVKYGGKLIFTGQDLWNVPSNFSGTIYFNAPDVESYYSVVKDKVSIAWPLQKMSYGTHEFAIKDCNGYLLAFQQHLTAD